MKAQKNLTNIMRPLGRLWAPLDHLKKDNKDFIDLNKLLELVEQYVILVGQCHSRASCFRRQRVLGALLKDRRQVKPLLKERGHCFEKKRKVLFREKFQKKVNKSLKTKKKIKELLKEYTKPTWPSGLIIMDPVSQSFSRAPISIHGDGGINYIKIKVLCQEMVKKNLFQGRKT